MERIRLRVFVIVVAGVSMLASGAENCPTEGRKRTACLQTEARVWRSQSNAMAEAQAAIASGLMRGAVIARGDGGALEVVGEAASGRPMTERTLFYIASVTETFTAAAAALPAAEGKLNADGLHALATHTTAGRLRYDCANFVALGFDMSDAMRPAGLSSSAVFHSGWTGQTIAVDPETGFCGVVLMARTGDHGAAKIARNRILSALARECAAERTQR